MSTLDITFDFETCALCPTAAVMSIGAVAWQRDGVKGTPFFLTEDGEIDSTFVFSRHVDLRGMFVDGFTFDAETSAWWARQDENAKTAVLQHDETPLLGVDIVIDDFFYWIRSLKHEYGFKEVYLWSQGSDFDVAILRNICQKYGINIPVSYKNFRDHRTFYMEGAHIICDIAGAEFEPGKAYSLVDEYDGEGVPHDPVYDCKRSIWNTWQMMRHLRCLKQVTIKSE